VIVKAEFDEILSFGKSLGEVSISHDEWGYMNREGQFVWRAPQSERSNGFEHDPLEGITKEEIDDSCK